MTTKMKAAAVRPGDVIRIPGLGFRSVTETEYNLGDRSVVFTCGSEEVMHEVPEHSVLTVYGTLPPSAPPEPKSLNVFRTATFLAASMLLAILAALVTR